MRIADGGVTDKDWAKLNLKDAQSPDWGVAIRIFKQRIHGRFIEPCDKLVQIETPLPCERRKYGFAIMSIDCLLIETIQSFREGVVGEPLDGTRDLFVRFLTQSGHFNRDFDARKAAMFYRDYRCHLLHSGMTRGQSLVRFDGPLVSEEGGYLRINRRLFHERVKAAFDLYCMELEDTSNDLLRDKFRKKMADACSPN